MRFQSFTVANTGQFGGTSLSYNSATSGGHLWDQGYHPSYGYNGGMGHGTMGNSGHSQYVSASSFNSGTGLDYNYDSFNTYYNGTLIHWVVGYLFTFGKDSYVLNLLGPV